MNNFFRRLAPVCFATFSLLSINTLSFAETDPQAEQTPISSNQDLPLDEIRTFAEVLEHIRRNHIEESTDRELIENAIKGLLLELDPHSTYLDPERFADLQVNTQGEFGGLGIEVGNENGYVKVISPIDDSPASRAGIQSGDLIVEINGHSLEDRPLDESIEMMRGEVGTSIDIKVLRQSSPSPLDFTLVRDKIRLTSVKSRHLQHGIAYVRVTQFQINSGQEVKKAIDELQQDSELSGLILDLRNNPGGVLTSAVKIADLFLHSGKVVYTQGRAEEAYSEFNATPGDILDGKPIIILVNIGSASASEIVAGALQDHHRAIILGTRTFGKGSVQTVLPLMNNRALKLTTARYYTPSGRTIQAQGIEPDIIVEQSHIEQNKNNYAGYSEADLPGHLEGGSDNSNNEQPNNDTSSEVNPNDDYQLYQAITTLQGINLIKSYSVEAEAAEDETNATDDKNLENAPAQ